MLKICEAERRNRRLKKLILALMLSHCRGSLIRLQWWIVKWSPVEWSYQMMCVMEASSLVGNPHIFWVAEIRYHQSVCGTDPNGSLFEHSFGLVDFFFFTTLVCAISQEQHICEPKGGICNQNNADKIWIAPKWVGHLFCKTIQKIFCK